jgi:hypothetical protein
MVLAPLSSAPSATSTCYDIKAAYQDSACCGATLMQQTSYMVSPPPPTPMSFGANPCAGAKPYDSAPNNGDGYFYNTNCTLYNGVIDVLEQAAANVTAGYVGGMDAGGRVPVTEPYYKEGLCPVNVHWHLGAEHYSAGQFDEYGTGPANAQAHRRLGEGTVRRGFQCRHYDTADPKFTTPYEWKYCDASMMVGETYEIHWPHSAAGMCGTPWQYQSPFYDGVFCVGGIITLAPLNTYQKIGVQGQVFTIVNDESYYYPDLIKGMIVDGVYGADVAKYTGSTTGTSRDNNVCSRYTPITWQVDRTCHMISASSFDKMCKDMMTQQDDMSTDLYAHGARELVLNEYAANNHVRQMRE